LQQQFLLLQLQLQDLVSGSSFGGSSFGVSGLVSTSIFGGSTLFSSRQSGVKESGLKDNLEPLTREVLKAEVNLAFNGAATLATLVFFKKQEVVLNMLYSLLFKKIIYL
jgi:hypothetical protein